MLEEIQGGIAVVFAYVNVYLFILTRLNDSITDRNRTSRCRNTSTSYFALKVFFRSLRPVIVIHLSRDITVLPLHELSNRSLLLLKLLFSFFVMTRHFFHYPSSIRRNCLML